MRRIVVDMQNALFTDAIAAALRNFDSDFEVFESELPQKTAELCGDVRADVLIAEVTSCTPWTFEDRMKTRSELKKICRRCKIVLTVDENNEKNVADRVRRAKKDGLIDGLLYGSVSSAYLAHFLDTLSSRAQKFETEYAAAARDRKSAEKNVIIKCDCAFKCPKQFYKTN